MSRRKYWRAACTVVLLCATAIASPAQKFTTLVNLNGTSTANPYFVTLAQGADGDFYGTGQETVFKITPKGTLTTLYYFCPECGYGSYVEAGLVLANDGNFYGTTSMGGTYGSGTVFKITPEGTVTSLGNNLLDSSTLI